MHNNSIHTDSPYTILDDETMTKDMSVKDHADLSKLFREGTYKMVEYLILESLAIYKYLNRHNIKRYLDYKLKDKSWNNYYHVVKKLLEDNVLDRIRYGEHIFYTLPEYAEEYMKTRMKKKVVRYHVPETTENVLECAALAQWHISLVITGTVKHNGFYCVHKLAKQTYEIPSLAELTVGNYNYRVTSFAYPKKTEAEEFEMFWKRIINTHTGLAASSRKNQINLTVISVSTLKEMKEAQHQADEIPELENRMFYFVLEGNTACFEGLQHLYYYDRDGKKEERLTTISVN